MSQHNEQPFDDKDPLESDIRQMVRAAGNETMRPEEKAALWERIQSGFGKKPAVFRIGWQVAAAVAVLIAAGWWMLQLRQPQKGVMAFAKEHHIADTATETRLVLSNNRQVTLSGASTALAYNHNGTRVSVNDRVRYEQQPAGEMQYNTLIVPYGRRAKVSLQDGTEVWLNAGSRLVYPVVFDGKHREVFLEGEGYFDVAQNDRQPFFVYTSHLKTAVLGTEFNVNAYTDDEEETVVLVKGSVKVRSDKGNGEQLLSPGYKAGYSIATHNMRKENVHILEYTAWRDGRLVFEQAQLNHILKKLSRYFNVPITNQMNVSSTFSGDLDLSEDINNVMEAISVSTGLTYERTEQGFLFKK